MPVDVTWLGHSAFTIVAGDHRLLVDPFLDQNEQAPVRAAEVEADYILLTHGHFDHVDDAAPIAKRTGASVLANFEVCEWLKRQGLPEEKLIAMNPGGGVDLPFGRAKLTIAHHSSSMPDGSYGGVAGGFLLELQGARIYIAGDTALFLDMKLIGLGGLDLAILPIGDRYTMGPADAIEAVKLLAPRRATPCHYNTWPPIAQDAAAWSAAVSRETAATPVVLLPGESVRL
ncbi:MAG TPA: metal-dependent hydrolase [Lacipirellulaceae bacterium]|nr:metal-dependent hydrolase [Lacipirellulaceae bacterium]